MASLKHDNTTLYTNIMVEDGDRLDGFIKHSQKKYNYNLSPVC